MPGKRKKGKIYNHAKVESPYYRNLQGTGLGLSLAKSLREVQGGSLEIESKVGIGNHGQHPVPARENDLR